MIVEAFQGTSADMSANKVTEPSVIIHKYQPPEIKTEDNDSALETGGGAGSPKIALTFDDGPSEYTQELVELLVKQDSAATFFVVGNRLNGRDALLENMVLSGMEIGNHSFDHSNYTKMTTEQIKSNLNSVQNKVKDATGTAPSFFRPPYGAINDTVSACVGMPMILWSIDPQDWKNKDSDYVVTHIKERVKDGDIILLHDIHPTTIQAVKVLIPYLIEQGFELVTVSELYRSQSVVPVAGQTYYNA